MFGGKFRTSDDEDDFFGDVESSRAHLSNIFGISLDKPQQNSDHSLKYVAPKQTKAAPDAQKSDKSSGWNIQVAQVVTAFKLENQENVSQGKIGLAVLKSPENQLKVILYRTKSKVLSTFTIKDDSKVFLKSSYLQFCDDLNIFWSVLFETVENNEVLDLLKGKVLIEKTKENDNQPQIPQVTAENKVDCNSSDEKSDSKAQILTRMAKMGQPLPKMSPATTTDLSDSSDTECRTRLPPKPMVVPRKPKAQQQLVAVAPSSSTAIAPVLTNLATYTHNISQDSQYVNMLLCENRTQNAELRMNMSKLETKIEKVLDKIDIVGSRESRVSGKCKEDEILELEEKVLDLKKENRVFKVKIEELEALNRRIPLEEPLKQEDIDEFSHLVELFSIQTDQYTNSKDFYKSILSHLNTYCNSLKDENELSEISLDDSKKTLESLQKQKEQEIETLSDELSVLKEKLAQSEKQVEKLIAENKELAQLKEQCKEDAEKMVDTMLKDIMNNLYRTLVTKFEDNKSYSSMEILRICGGAIKNETNNAIKKKNCED